MLKLCRMLVGLNGILWCHFLLSLTRETHQPTFNGRCPSCQSEWVSFRQVIQFSDYSSRWMVLQLLHKHRIRELFRALSHCSMCRLAFKACEIKSELQSVVQTGFSDLIKMWAFPVCLKRCTYFILQVSRIFSLLDESRLVDDSGMCLAFREGTIFILAKWVSGLCPVIQRKSSHSILGEI